MMPIGPDPAAQHCYLGYLIPTLGFSISASTLFQSSRYLFSLSPLFSRMPHCFSLRNSGEAKGLLPGYRNFGQNLEVLTNKNYKTKKHSMHSSFACVDKLKNRMSKIGKCGGTCTLHSNMIPVLKGTVTSEGFSLTIPSDRG